MDERISRKQATDKIRDSLAISGDYAEEDVLAMVAKLKEWKAVNPGELFPFVMAVKRLVAEKLDPNWLYEVAIPKALKVPIAWSVIMSDTISINRSIQSALKDCIYVVGNRALFFREDAVCLCDVTNAEPIKLAEKYNDAALEKMDWYLKSKNDASDPADVLLSIMQQAKMLNFDRSEDVIDFDNDEGEFHFGRFSDIQEELVRRLEWLTWLDTATEAEIQNELHRNPEALRWLTEAVDVENGKDGSMSPETKKKILHLVKT